jgi:ribosomal protein S18 acetylase RimI-like enzyme
LNAPLHMRFALPDDPDLDAFVSGNREVDAYFRARQWFNVAKGVAAPPTYQFLTEVDGEVVGYASLAFRKSDHPFDGSDERALYLLIYVIGIHERFQGRRNAKGSNESFAASIIRMLANLAGERDACVGLGLWVRADNARAIAFYKKVGFESDPGGAVQRDGGVPHLTMRAFLASGTD